LSQVLDDNRELFIPETQQVVKAHSHFLLFGAQNPPGLYGGRKVCYRLCNICIVLYVWCDCIVHLVSRFCLEHSVIVSLSSTLMTSQQLSWWLSYIKGPSYRSHMQRKW